MSGLVLDASVTMSWCFEDEHSAYSKSILNELRHSPAVVPTIWKFEVANVLVIARRKGRLTEAALLRFVTLLCGLPIAEAKGEVAIREMVALGLDADLSAYDAAYVHLASRENLPLATEDKRLREAATKLGVRVL